MNGWREEFMTLVRAELAGPTADVIDGLPLRPAVKLSAAQPADPVVGRLGGPAGLPAGMSWPLLPDGEALMHIVTLDCAALTAYEIDLVLPGSGTLLFFLPEPESDLRFDDLAPTVIFVAGGVATVEQEPPAHLRSWAPEFEPPLTPLTGRTIASVPGAHNPAFGEEDARQEMTDLLWRTDDRLTGLLQRYRGLVDHQVGGYSDAFQYPLESGAVHRRRKSLPHWDPDADPTYYADAREWLTLLQLDESDGLIWGDGGLAMWAIRRADLAALDFTDVHFTIDSH
ncbi:DUF1963 domain-containing protein [Micromonosporaceae bacterium Da 78-11]